MGAVIPDSSVVIAGTLAACPPLRWKRVAGTRTPLVSVVGVRSRFRPMFWPRPRCTSATASGDAHHKTATDSLAAAAEAGDEFIVPASVLAQVLVGAARQGPGVRDRLEHRLASVDRLYPVDRDVALHAADVRATHDAVWLPDALVIGTGRALGAAVPTADKRLAKVDERVRVVG
jgi:PIN domain nuclease of toxin-antitoxin system